MQSIFNGLFLLFKSVMRKLKTMLKHNEKKQFDHSSEHLLIFLLNQTQKSLFTPNPNRHHL